MSYSWFRRGTCTVAQGSTRVDFTAANLLTAKNKPVVGDAFTVDGSNLYEVIALDSDTRGEYATLERPFGHAGVTSVPYAMMRLASSTQNAKLVAMASAGINQKQISLDDMYEWYTADTPTVSFHGPDGTVIQVPSYHSLSQDIQTVSGNVSAVEQVAQNIDAIKTAEANAQTATQKAQEAEASATSAKGSEDQAGAYLKQIADNVLSLSVADSASSSFMNSMRAQNLETYAASNLVHMGKGLPESTTNNAVNEGLWVTPSTGQVRMGRRSSDGAGKSKSEYPIAHVAGFISKLKGLNSAATDGIDFKTIPPEKGTRVFDSSDGSSIDYLTEAGEHSSVAANLGEAVTRAFAAAASSDTKEVATSPVDLYSTEYFLQRVTPERPRVFPYGVIQSTETTMAGVATSDSPYPASYHAAYDGDTTSSKKSVDIFAASVIEQDALFGDPEQNIFYLGKDQSDKPIIVQWCVRNRQFRGFSNGDWYNVNPATSLDRILTEVRSLPWFAHPAPQGKQDTPKERDDVTANHIYSSRPQGTYNWNSQQGVFTATNSWKKDVTFGYDGLCFLLPMFTASTLNAGLYHFTLNPAGTALASDGKDWTQTSVTFTTAKDCFDPAKLLAGSGYRASGKSGHPEGRYCDSVYAGGLGGIVDLRPKYGAWDASSAEQAAVVRAEVEAGVYRGKEKLKFTRVRDVTFVDSSQGGWNHSVYAAHDKMGQTISVDLGPGYTIDGEARGANDIASCKQDFQLGGYLQVGETEYRKIVGSPASVNSTRIKIESDKAKEATWVAWLRTQIAAGNKIKFVQTVEINITVSGAFQQTDVIVDPANISQYETLKDGWPGSWMPKLPTGSDGTTYTLNRKCLSATLKSAYTEDNGATWAAGDISVKLTTNSRLSNLAVNSVTINTYTAFAKQTKPCMNQSVLHGRAGVGDVFATSHSKQTAGCLLNESLTGKIGKGIYDSTAAYSMALKTIQFENTGQSKLGMSTNIGSTHDIVTSLDASNGTSAVKALGYQIETNDQASLAFAWNELKHDGTDWGDNGKVHIVSNTDTYTDLNSETCLCGTAELAIPYGYIK